MFIDILVDELHDITYSVEGLSDNEIANSIENLKRDFYDVCVNLIEGKNSVFSQSLINYTGSKRALELDFKLTEEIYDTHLGYMLGVFVVTDFGLFSKELCISFDIIINESNILTIVLDGKDLEESIIEEVDNKILFFDETYDELIKDKYFMIELSEVVYNMSKSWSEPNNDLDNYIDRMHELYENMNYYYERLNTMESLIKLCKDLKGESDWRMVLD